MNSTTGLVFVDSNILIYANDENETSKRNIAADRLRELWNTGSGTLSTQVLQEFYNTVTRKLRASLHRDAAKAVVADYGTWPVVLVDHALILDACDIEGKQQLSFWDSLIVAAAVRSGAGTILTEDLQDGQLIEGIRIENPFARR